MIVAAETAAPGAWLLASGAHWWDLVRYGPPGFEVYARVDFDEGDTPARALELLASRTGTPEAAYAAVWEGWCGRPPPPAPVLLIPARTMHLFAATVAELREGPAAAWGQHFPGVPPHLAWPEDRAWCLACEVDEDFAFTVGCDRSTLEHLAEALPGGVREVSYGADEPLWRN